MNNLATPARTASGWGPRDVAPGAEHPPPGGGQLLTIGIAIEAGRLWLPLAIAGRDVRALIDTGAATSCLPRALALHLGLAAIPGVSCSYPSDPRIYRAYACVAEVRGADGARATIRFPNLFEAQAGRHDFMLVGMDVLARARFVVDRGAVSLTLYDEGYNS